MSDIKTMIHSIAAGEKEVADAEFTALMRDRVKAAIDTKTIEVANNVFNNNSEEE